MNEYQAWRGRGEGGDALEALKVNTRALNLSLEWSTNSWERDRREKSFSSSFGSQMSKGEERMEEEKEGEELVLSTMFS
jgi:hypothetical protein